MTLHDEWISIVVNVSLIPLYSTIPEPEFALLPPWFFRATRLGLGAEKNGLGSAKEEVIVARRMSVEAIILIEVLGGDRELNLRKSVVLR